MVLSGTGNLDIALPIELMLTLRDALYKLQRCPSVSLAQISTPLFAYEPVLRGLQATRPTRFLRDGTLLSKPHKPRATSGDLSDIGHESIPGLIRNLRMTADINKPVTLDNAQTEAFICGLTQKVALIQGPPGIHFPIAS